MNNFNFNNSNNVPGVARDEGPVHLVNRALQMAGILANVVVMPAPEVHDAMPQNGGVDTPQHVGLQPAYHGYQQDPLMGLPEYPVLRLPEIPDNVVDFVTDFPINVVQEQGGYGAPFEMPILDVPNIYEAAIANVVPIVDEVLPPQPSCVSASDNLPSQAPRASASDNLPSQASRVSSRDSDSDFEVTPSSRRAAKSQSQETPKTPIQNATASSVAPRPEGKMKKTAANVQAGPSVNNSSSAPSKFGSASSVLKSMLEKRDLPAVSKRTVAVKKNAPNKRQVNRRVSNTRRVTTTPNTAGNVTLEAGCSSAVLPAAEVVERISIQSSDSESEFDVFSQADDKNLFMQSCKRRRQLKAEYNAMDGTVRADINSIETMQNSLRDVDAELRRLDEERQRLEERRNTIRTNIERRRASLKEHRGSLDRVAKKLKLIEKF